MIKTAPLPLIKKDKRKINKSRFIAVAKRVQKALKEESKYLELQKRNENYYAVGLL